MRWVVREEDGELEKKAEALQGGMRGLQGHVL